jgi:transposase-like protein
MRNSKPCPKCQSNDIVRIPGDRAGARNFIMTGGAIFNAVKVTRYLCASCGFSEEWIDSRDDITKLKKKYGS